MKHNKKKLRNIPTNLITGFLGVGKTSAILHFMTQKPENEKWSVLVNEFGSVGIDGAIYRAKGIDVKEIPGGCMCCAAGVPLQVAVNRILSETRPQRLLIEPSGLGHPKRVLDTLQGQYFKEALSLKASICLLDPRKLSDKRYTTHENFIDQIALADVLVANKIDLCDDNILKQFDEYSLTLVPAKQEIIKTRQGHLDASILELNPSAEREAKFPHFHESTNKLKTDASKDGFYSEAWQFSKETVFSYDKLVLFLEQFNQSRIKAVLNTDNGWFIFNIQGKQKEIYAIGSSADNRLEIISRENDKLDKKALNQQLLESRIAKGISCESGS